MLRIVKKIYIYINNFCIYTTKGFLAIFWGVHLISTAFCADVNLNEVKGTRDIKPVFVLQNRYFLKGFRPEIGIYGGKFIDEAYTVTLTTGIRAGMFISEWVGFEMQYTNTFVTDSADKNALDKMRYKKADALADDNTLVKVEPEMNPISKYIDMNFVYAPFYGKLNLINWWIIYSDIYLSLGLSQITTKVQGTKYGPILGVGQRFYLFKIISFRVDIRDHVFQEKRAGSNYYRHAINFDLGLSIFLF